ncbi:hypothetical protein CI1B_27500 [Bradyrhizobium ivorense]|uniref:Uncharacterized protein n=1 Tax=Bradyrhizobium ivorense TaxID=2511166 RepID=A0A508T6W2_9BRAD|nr:hypothetical protein [Bradyrhizobium ivorense]VIO69544.1 hypothetical protein CI1B_27500 [Bradyrhizobium ivorense]VIO71290.1 hypothetical protein CI41S_29610 [Bradyrhizobium ivorense]
MTSSEIVFEIDDSKTVDQNISALSVALKQIDDPLADVLSGALSKLSLEIALDQGTLLDALYVAGAPIESQETPSEEGAAE